MTQPVDARPQAPMLWSEAWLIALLKPSTTNYETLARDPGATTRRAYGWIFSAAIVYAGVTTIIGGASEAWIEVGGTRRTTLLIEGLFALLVFIFVTFTMHCLARLLRGRGTYEQLVYTCATFCTPMLLLLGLTKLLELVSQPASSLLSLATSVYTALLTVTALKAVNQFGWIKASIAAAPVLLVHLVLVAVVLASLLPNALIP